MEVFDLILFVLLIAVVLAAGRSSKGSGGNFYVKNTNGKKRQAPAPRPSGNGSIGIKPPATTPRPKFKPAPQGKKS